MSFSRMARLIKQDQSGFTILEAMIGGILLGIVAVGILPALVGLIETQKVSSFKSVCSAYTRAKLNEYVNGYGSGQLGYIPTGYEYTKYRYQQYALTSAAYCTSPTPANPGWRERVSSNTIVAPNAGQEPDLGGKMQGFQLYVMIKNYNMRELTSPGNQPTRECPAADYQFYALGDAFEVTVTGMVRTNPLISEGGRRDTSITDPDQQERPWGGLKDIDASTPNPRLTCSATQIIYPQRSPFRYYIGSDGKIRSYQATYALAQGSVTSSLEAMEAHYRSLWSSAANNGELDTPTLGNVQSFAISPDNKSAYTLKPGELSRYDDCTYRTVTVGGLNFPGVPDCSLDDADVMVWQVDSNIENITVDFKDVTNRTDDRIYGFYNTGTTTGVGEARIKALDTDGLNDGDFAPWVDPEATESFTFPEGFPRIRGMFIGQPFPPVAKPNMFFFDNTCYQPPGASSSTNWVYCTTIFNSGDQNQAFEVRELPVQTEGISY